MAHEFTSGFVVRQRAWHGLGTLLDDNPSIDEALQHAGLDWSIGTRKIFCSINEADGLPDSSIESHRAVIREDNGTVLGIVSKDYVPLQNVEALEVFRPLVEDGTLALETAGVLQDGRKIWVQARYASDAEIGDGDVVIPYLLIAAGHDGKMGIHVCNTPVRVVCWNTMQAAGATEDARAGSSFQRERAWRFVHTGDVKGKVQLARDALVDARKDWEHTVKVYRAMQNTPCTEAKLREIAQTVFDGSLKTAERTLEKLRASQAKRAEFQDQKFNKDVSKMISELEDKLADWKPARSEREIVRAFHEGPGADMAGETVWGAMNAITHFIDHGRIGSVESRASASWFGVGQGKRHRAFQIGAELVGM